VSQRGGARQRLHCRRSLRALVLTEPTPVAGCVAVRSPFYRTCQTCQPLAQALGQQARVVVNPDIYENGGVYIAGQDADGNAVRDGPGECMSAADIREKFPGYETDMLPQEGPWYTDGFETEAMSSARAERGAAWLKSPELQVPPRPATEKPPLLSCSSCSVFRSLRSINQQLSCDVRKFVARNIALNSRASLGNARCCL